MTTDLLTVTNLTKRYADYQLTNVSFSLPAGYIMGFMVPMVPAKRPQSKPFWI